MMRLADEVRAEIQAFVAGRITAREFEGWLDSVAPEIHDEGDVALRSLTDWVFSLLAEASYGDRTATEIRRELSSLILTPTTEPKSAAPRPESSVAPGASD